MLSRTLRTLALVLFAGLAACGFAPVNGPNSAGGDLVGTIAFDDPGGADAFTLLGRLHERLGVASDPVYQASHSLSLATAPQAISPLTNVSRTTLTGTLTLSISDRSGATLTSVTVDNFLSYSTAGTTNSSTAASDDARRRLIVILADQAVNRLLATAADWAG